MIATGLLALLAASAAPAPAAAPPPKPGWTVDWGDRRCSLIREGQPALTLQIIPGTTQIQLYLFDPRWREPPFSRDPAVPVELSPGGSEVIASGEAAKSVNGQFGIKLNKLERPFLDQLAAAGELTIRHDGKVLAAVPIPGAAKAIAALRQCEASALADWGLDAPTMMSLRSYAKPTGGDLAWINDNDYPDQAIRNEESGTAVVLLKVGADGIATGCAVVDSSGSKALDEQTCAIYGRRAHYDPAIDAKGKPTMGLAAVRIRWVFP
jgi:TonB family protein